jgi:hypothetical protein
MINSFMCVSYLLSSFINILGCWQLRETTTYQINQNGERYYISKEVSNVSPTATFLFNGKGLIEYCNGETTQFSWQNDSANTINVTCTSLGDKSFCYKLSDEDLILVDRTNNCLANEYKLKRSNLKIEEYEGNSVKVSDCEYKNLKQKNPFSELLCFVVEGYEKDNRILRIGGQEFLEIVNGLPNKQCIVFVKTFNNQNSFPCYLVTKVKEKNNIILFANYIRHFKIHD